MKIPYFLFGCIIFFVNFHDRPFKGNLLFSIKLTGNNEYHEDDLYKINAWLSNTHYHRPVFKIISRCEHCDGDSVYLTGYNFEDAEEKKGRYPVFSKKCPKIYFTREKAFEIAEQLKIDGYKVDVV